MRILFLMLSLMSFSSCIAVLGLGALGATIAIGDSGRHAKEGAEKEDLQRALHAREAAVIRQRYNEEEARCVAAAEVALPVRPSLTPPPMVALEPVRTPLQPRGVARP